MPTETISAGGSREGADVTQLMAVRELAALGCFDPAEISAMSRLLEDACIGLERTPTRHQRELAAWLIIQMSQTARDDLACIAAAVRSLLQRCSATDCTLHLNGVARQPS